MTNEISDLLLGLALRGFGALVVYVALEEGWRFVRGRWYRAVDWWERRP